MSWGIDPDINYSVFFMSFFLLKLNVIVEGLLAFYAFGNEVEANALDVLLGLEIILNLACFT